MKKSFKSKKVDSDNVNAKINAKKVNPFANTLDNIKKINPFEVHINKEKFNILGRTCKHDKGLPGVSRAKANQKRKETLEKEYRMQNKNNQFRDRRIGRHLTGDQMTEEVMNARFLAEKMSQMKPGKSSRFNLNDDEVLTHRGQTLEEIEQFHDDRSDDEDDNEKLDAEFTEAAHFGGDAEDGKDRQTAIEDMILEQKRKKLEIAKEKEEVQSLTDKLDKNFKECLPWVGKMTRGDEQTKAPPDDYDKVLREMIFEPRGVVTDKLLSEEDLAKQEKERLEELEAERKRRMLGDIEEEEEKVAKPKHRSADDLDDSYFAIESVEVTPTLTYTADGKINLGNEKELPQEEEEEENIHDDDDEEQEGEEEEESDEDSENDDDNDEEDDNSDDLSDLKYSPEEEEDLEAVEVPKKAEKPAITKNVNLVRLDLPFTIEMPNTYAQFKSFMIKHATADQGILLERLIKSNHPKLEVANKEKICKLFAFLLEYINEHFSDASVDNIREQFKLLSNFNAQLYDLLQLQPERMSTSLLNVIKQKQAEYRKNAKTYPPIETVIFFKLVSNFYSTSDFRHAVVTPCNIFMSQILSKARVRTKQDIALGLFMVTIIMECTQQSHRFLPAALNFLLGVVYLCIPKRPIEVYKIVPPFQSTGIISKLLAIPSDDEEAKLVPEGLLKSEDLVQMHIDVDFKVRALNMSLKLIADSMETLKENVAVNLLALPFLQMLERLSLDVYPEYVQKNFKIAQQILDEVSKKPLQKLTAPERKPKALRLLEPQIETVYNDKRRPKMSQEKEERVKLQHKVKRETKGAIRELRRDTHFLQKIKIKEQIQSDMERKEKVKRIYQEASLQQGELNELDRAKKKKKF